MDREQAEPGIIRRNDGRVVSSSPTGHRRAGVATVEMVRNLGRLIVSLAAVVVLGAACSPGAEPDRAEVTNQANPASLVGPDAFAARMAEPNVVTINVHVPDEGHLDGTDLTIAFDTISSSTLLPSDKTTPLAVYCRSGNMSADAVEDLAAMGYVDIVELDGGFDAWVASGRTLEPPGS